MSWKRKRQREKAALYDFRLLFFFLSFFSLPLLRLNPTSSTLLPPPITVLIYENIQTWHWAYDKHQVCIWGGEEINSSSGCDHYLCPDQSYSSRPACGGQPYQSREGWEVSTHPMRSHTNTHIHIQTKALVESEQCSAHMGKLTSLPWQAGKEWTRCNWIPGPQHWVYTFDSPFLIGQISSIRELWSQTDI